MKMKLAEEITNVPTANVTDEMTAAKDEGMTAGLTTSPGELMASMSDGVDV